MPSICRRFWQNWRAAVELNDKLYVVGGYADGWTPIDDLYEYDPASDRWLQLAAMPTARGALGAPVLGGKIHAVAGSGRDRRNTPAHEVYDPATDQWQALAPIPTQRDHLAVAVVEGQLFAIGGRVDGSYLQNLDVSRGNLRPVVSVYITRLMMLAELSR